MEEINATLLTVEQLETLYPRAPLPSEQSEQEATEEVEEERNEVTEERNSILEAIRETADSNLAENPAIVEAVEGLAEAIVEQHEATNPEAGTSAQEEQPVPDWMTPFVEQSEQSEQEVAEEAEDEVLQTTQSQQLSEDVLHTDIGSRFSGATWFEGMQNLTIIVGGAGGISSWFIAMLARTNPRLIQVFDADEVEAANLSGQLFSMSDIGTLKVDAARTRALQLSNYSRVECFDEFYTGSTDQVGPIMICGFDNMTARKVFYSKWKSYALAHPEERCLFMDGRLNAESFQIFTITSSTPEYMTVYEDSWLFDDEEADGVVCSYKQTTFCAAMIASFMNNILINFVYNGVQGILFPRDIPFMTAYEADQVFLRTRV